MIICFLAVFFAACSTDDDDPTTYRVTFDTDGGTPTVGEQTVKSGDKVQEPEIELTKPDSVFSVWINTATDQEYNFDAPVTADLNLKATYAKLVSVDIKFHTDYLYNSEVERYHVVVTKKGSGGTPDTVLEDAILTESVYKAMFSQVADNDTVNLNIKAYKKPTQNTSTLTAEALDPTTNDADGRILAASVNLNLQGRELQKHIDLYFGTGGQPTSLLGSAGKAQGSLRMVWDFTPFQNFLQSQTPPATMQPIVHIQRQVNRMNVSTRWKTVIALDVSKTGKTQVSRDIVEIHQALDPGNNQYRVELTLSTGDALDQYRFVGDNTDFKYNSYIVMPQPMYAGEKIERTTPLEFKNGTQELSGWPENP